MALSFHSTPELRHLQSLLKIRSPLLREEELATVPIPGTKETVAINALTMGSEEDNVPVLVLVGGVHGVERIGSQVVLAFMETLIQRLQWDRSLTDGLEQLRLVFIPVANPVGLINQTRSNGRGVDLMRNAPVDALARTSWLAGGHRLGGWLPWYRGKGAVMEVEAQALVDRVMLEVERSPCVVTLDVHSGFGLRDRLWFPYACSYEPVPNLAEFYALDQLLRSTYPHLDYIFEPQSNHYLTHGDLWDWMHMQSLEKDRLLLPLTLELGSWRWVKKNPLQIRSLSGLFNPVIPHRVQRVLRRHIVLMEFLIRATRAYEAWLPAPDQRVFQQRAALRQWYENYREV